MASCIHCGRWAGVGSREHHDCAQLAAEGKKPAEIRETINGATGAIEVPVKPVTERTVAFGVFYGMLMYSAVLVAVGIVVAVFRSILG